MKQLITSIIVVGILLKVLFSTSDLLTILIVLPFLIFAVGIGVKNIFILMKKDSYAIIASKVCAIAFLVYWFGFLVYWDYVSFTDGDYIRILFSVPLWLGGIYVAYKRLFKKK